jgi:hypothetical protein
MIRRWPSHVQHRHTVMFMVARRLAAGSADAVTAQPTRKEARMSGEARAIEPEDVTRLVAERLNAGDAAGVAIYQQMADAGVRFAIETPLPTVRFEDLALTSTRSTDNTGVRVQVLRRQPDGSWLRIIDRPEVPQP